MSDYHINVFYSEEDAAYVADIPDLEACSAFGASAEEALAEVEQAKRAWLAAAEEAGRPIPEPRYRPVQRAAEIQAAQDQAQQSGIGLWGPPCFGQTQSVPV